MSMRASPLMEALTNPDLGDLWIAAYVHWELGVLSDLGYGLDLDRCAATGTNDDLAYVSPRTGRAVSLSAGEPYQEKLLAMPGFPHRTWRRRPNGSGTGVISHRALSQASSVQCPWAGDTIGPHEIH